MSLDFASLKSCLRFSDYKVRSGQEMPDLRKDTTLAWDVG